MKKLVLLVASLAMLLATTATLTEGCDTNGDGVPELRAGEPAPDDEASTSAMQYDTTL